MVAADAGTWGGRYLLYRPGGRYFIYHPPQGTWDRPIRNPRSRFESGALTQYREDSIDTEETTRAAVPWQLAAGRR